MYHSQIAIWIVIKQPFAETKDRMLRCTQIQMMHTLITTFQRVYEGWKILWPSNEVQNYIILKEKPHCTIIPPSLFYLLLRDLSTYLLLTVYKKCHISVQYVPLWVIPRYPSLNCHIMFNVFRPYYLIYRNIQTQYDILV